MKRTCLIAIILSLFILKVESDTEEIKFVSKTIPNEFLIHYTEYLNKDNRQAIINNALKVIIPIKLIIPR